MIGQGREVHDMGRGEDACVREIVCYATRFVLEEVATIAHA